MLVPWLFEKDSNRKREESTSSACFVATIFARGYQAVGDQLFQMRQHRTFSHAVSFWRDIGIRTSDDLAGSCGTSAQCRENQFLALLPVGYVLIDLLIRIGHCRSVPAKYY